jgi:hypothetical protein
MNTLNIDVPDDYQPSDGEIDNIVYLICKYTVSWGMRQADLAVCKMMAERRGLTGKEGISNLAMVTCEYVWDHICGEPDDTSPEAFFEHMRPMLEEWYGNSTPEERANTG